ncbi:MAG TPA: hypothetical protein VMV05_00100, partial [bacterium]|nr:hypothetical protein [bacterium]
MRLFHDGLKYAMPNRTRFLLLFLFIFLVRLFYGLLQSQWQEPDEVQTYLIGLKCYTTGTWPYFGPDVTGSENPGFTSQIPGALEGIVIGWPFYLLPIPETPFILLALMTTLGAALLAWYISKRVPTLPFAWLFLWISVTPWTLVKYGHVINPAYNFLPSVLFFVGFMETIPAFTLRLVPPLWANALMGFSLFWIMQFHFSYVYFLPLAAYSLFVQFKETHGGMPLVFFTLGSLPMLALIAPTFLHYGLNRGNVVSGFAVPFN